jgi:hypothetical protein
LDYIHAGYKNLGLSELSFQRWLGTAADACPSPIDTIQKDIIIYE